MKPIVIRASAGTGKTYRLSLEFINLILKYRINFDEILVITFTKKATAEIRERIFEQLAQIVDNTEEGIELQTSFQKDINPDIEFNRQDIAFLKEVHQKMLTNKTAVRISTIDSFVNTIFSGIIAPYHNIMEFKIDNKITKEILPEIYEHILQDDKLKIFADIFLQAKRRNLDQFGSFISDIIENRWLFEFIDLSEMQNLNIEEEKEKTFSIYKDRVRDFIELLQSEFIKKDAEIGTLLQKDFKKSIISYFDNSDFNKSDFTEILFNILTNPEFIDDNFKLLLDNKNLWNGSKIRNPELKELYAEMQISLADFLFYDKALIEQLNIISLAAEILKVYDEIKFRDKIFTHSDISYYTFRFLYDTQLSIIDNGNVLNIFYEQLSYNTRFVLIDEFQDTSILQWSIFKPMLKEIISGIGQKEYGNIIVVGDEKQAIYGWRGGERRLLTEFAKILGSEVNSGFLTTSYRSKPVMVNWLNRLFHSEQLNSIQNWQYSDIGNNKPEGGFVQVHLRNTQQIEGLQNKINRTQIYQEFVQNILLKHIEEASINPADTAILMRKNSELKDMAEVLDEYEIDYTLETSGSLFEYRAIKPILFILNFLVYEDPYELVKFLRSDLVLMYLNELEKILNTYNNSAGIDDFLKNTESNIFDSLLKIKNSDGTLINRIKLIIEEFGFIQVFSSEIELKNLQRFLEVAAEFERINHEYTVDVFGFLKYCRALSEKDEYSQIGQTIGNSIKLLTIHKSKGLQFETVFTVFDVTSKLGGNRAGLNLYYNFSDDFTQLEDYAFTFNYNKVLKKSQKQLLIESVQKRDQGDELNNLYVALTRAKNNLFIYLHYNKKGDLEKLVKDVKDDSSILKIITKTIYNEFADDLQEISAVYHKLEYGKITKESVESDKINEVEYSFNESFKLFSLKDAKLCEPKKIEQIKKEFLENQSVLIGNIVHEYLSYIKYAQPKELEAASNKTIAKYGSLMNIIKLKKIISKVDKFINENSKFFNKDNWDKIFNEFSIFDVNKEYRIDRLMIDTHNKEILIVDYKTGYKFDEEQLDRYKAIIEKLPVVVREKYRVETKFVEVRV